MGKRLISRSLGQHFGISCRFQFCLNKKLFTAAGIEDTHLLRLLSAGF